MWPICWITGLLRQWENLWWFQRLLISRIWVHHWEELLSSRAERTIGSLRCWRYSSAWIPLTANGGEALAAFVAAEKLCSLVTGSADCPYSRCTQSSALHHHFHLMLQHHLWSPPYHSASVCVHNHWRWVMTRFESLIRPRIIILRTELIGVPTDAPPAWSCDSAPESLSSVFKCIYSTAGMSLVAEGVHSMRCINWCMLNVFHMYTSVLVVKL